MQKIVADIKHYSLILKSFFKGVLTIDKY